MKNTVVVDPRAWGFVFVGERQLEVMLQKLPEHSEGKEVITAEEAEKRGLRWKTMTGGPFAHLSQKKYSRNDRYDLGLGHMAFYFAHIIQLFAFTEIQDGKPVVSYDNPLIIDGRFDSNVSRGERVVTPNTIVSPIMQKDGDWYSLASLDERWVIWFDEKNQAHMKQTWMLGAAGKYLTSADTDAIASVIETHLGEATEILDIRYLDRTHGIYANRSTSVNGPNHAVVVVQEPKSGFAPQKYLEKVTGKHLVAFKTEDTPGMQDALSSVVFSTAAAAVRWGLL